LAIVAPKRLFRRGNPVGPIPAALPAAVAAARQAGNTPVIPVQHERPILSPSDKPVRERETVMKTLIERYITGAALVGNAALLAMLALSSTLFVGHG
jgi:hypothetical protein